MNRIEHNCITGETTIVELTPEEVAEAESRAAAEASAKSLTVTADPVAKLAAFLAANPDVAALL